ncbi:MAG: sodium-dependent transporter [Propionibacteriaceae bacterium]|nr:sodium-dependent transporter [Propionibacteriaceae bacterium]
MGRPKQEIFNSRNFFILAAIGSAVGLGNIWRFPYVAFDNGGGAFILPYLVALLAVGIPLLFFDYAIGHRYRGSAPLALRRLGRWTETLGWWQVMVCFMIAIYYAAVVAWAGMYTLFSFTRAWGDDSKSFLYGEFLHVAETPGVGFDFVPSLFLPMLLVWIVVLGTIALGVNKGLAVANLVFMPLLVVMFLILVVQALFLPGAGGGLDALFTPNWAALGQPGVWAAAFGQIFFSLSVGFGIMITYSSYLKRRTDLTGSGLVVGFANSGFELLAGIGVFAALGFMAAQAAGGDIAGVADDGLPLAFIAFPTILSQAPFGELMGVLFFGALTVAGITSLLSIVEVVVAAVRDKMAISKVQATLVVGVPMALISICLLATTTGIYFLDITDEFINKFGILAGAFACIVAVAWIVGKLPTLRRHLDRFSSFPTGRIWLVAVGGVAPVALGYILITDFLGKLEKPYEDYPLGLLGVYGWGMAVALVVVAVGLTLIPWRRSISTDFDETDNEHEVSA